MLSSFSMFCSMLFQASNRQYGLGLRVLQSIFQWTWRNFQNENACQIKNNMII